MSKCNGPCIVHELFTVRKLEKYDRNRFARVGQNTVIYTICVNVECLYI